LENRGQKRGIWKTKAGDVLHEKMVMGTKKDWKKSGKR